jgi:hypothetical protein
MVKTIVEVKGSSCFGLIFVYPLIHHHVYDYLEGEPLRGCLIVSEIENA